jgi:putative flippase GtrA
VSGLIGRWLKINFVGGLGIGVQLEALWLLVHWAQMHYMVATALAVEAAVLHNFAWH